LVEPFPSYGPFLIFQDVGHDGGRPPSWIFLQFQILTTGTVARSNLRHRATFRANRSSRCGDIAIFDFFKMAAAVHHIGFVLCDFGPPTKNI